MKKLVHNGIKYNLPENLTELTLGKYEQILNLNFDSEVETDYKIKNVAALSNVDENIIANLEQEQFDYLWSMTGWIVNTQPTKIDGQKPKQLFKVGDKQYYFNTNLDSKTAYKQFTDASQILAEHDSFWHCAPGVLATVIQPVKRIVYDFSKWKGFKKEAYIKHVELVPYDSANIETIANDLKDVSMADIQTTAFFFWNFTKILLANYIPTSSDNREVSVQNLQKILSRIFTGNGDGI